jgi:N utilization substance protein B
MLKLNRVFKMSEGFRENRKKRLNLIFALYQHDLVGSSNVLLTENENLIFQDCLSKIDLVDEIIEKNLNDYRIITLNTLDRNIIRYATYEMRFTNLHPNIVLNEAIEITKEYSDIDDLQYKFTNSVLDNIARYLKENNN